MFYKIGHWDQVVIVTNRIFHFYNIKSIHLGGNPGLVVMGEDSCPEGCGFECQHHILDGQFFTLTFYINWIDVCLKKTKNKLKNAGLALFKKSIHFNFEFKKSFDNELAKKSEVSIPFLNSHFVNFPDRLFSKVF